MPSLSPIQWIERTAARSGERVAIRDGDSEISYAELMSRANAVASGLRQSGAAPGVFIGIALDRSVDWVVAMLGVLKAGAAYVPLDPAYPAERLEFCARDCNALLVICDVRYKNISPENAITLLELSDETSDFEPIEPCHAHHPAYLLYTSGSTGRPKGVVVPVSAITYQMSWLIDQFDLRDSDVFLQKTSVAFDASVWEYLAPLMVGGTMVIAQGDPDSITEAVRHHGVTVLQVVPTILQALVGADKLGQMQSLRALFCGGEPLPWRLVEKVQSELLVPVVNLYGPTEATVQCAFHICQPGDPLTGSHVPLGRPIPGTVFHIDEQAGGELIIEGPCVTDGYHNQPALTAERFGVSAATGGRFYRSGDLVERDDNGDYLFHGRVDNQVKLRGLRIELGDIEEALKTVCIDVADAVAVVNPAGQIQVFVLTHQARWSEESVHVAMESKLPAYMLPSVYTLVAELPTLPNGKRDRKALQNASSAVIDAVPKSPSVTALEGEPEGTDIQARVRKAWSSLLPDAHSEDSHFFRSGGHSLLAMQLISSLNKAFGLRLSATSLFARPTLGALTEMVKRELADKQRSQISAGFIKMNGQPGAPKIWFVHPAGGAIWCYQEIVNAMSDSVESFGIECLPLDGNSHYESDLKCMAQRYADTLLERQPHGPYLICGYSFGGNVAYEMCSCLKSRGVDVSLLVLLDTYISRPTDFEAIDFVASYANKFTNGRNDAAPKEELLAMAPHALKQYLLALGIQGGHLPEGATVQDVEKGLSMWVANNTAAATHKVEMPYEGATLFVRCTLNARNSLEGWSDVLTSLEVECVAADHFSVYKRPASDQVAVLIEQAVLHAVAGVEHATA